MATITKYISPPLRGKSPYVRFLHTAIDLENDLLNVKLKQIGEIQDIWAIVGLKYYALASAVVGNRQIQIYHRSLWNRINDIVMAGWISEAFTASQGATILMDATGVITAGSLTTGGNVSDHFQAPKDSIILLGPDDYLSFTHATCQAGDAGFVYLTLKYLNYELGLKSSFEGM